MDNLRVLIVDDDRDVGVFMKMMLSKNAPHLEISYAEGGQECLEYLRENRPDCILSDFQMPGMNGLELLYSIRAGGDMTPFIFVTGQGNEEIAREAFKSGAYDYFTKDIGFAHFPRIINSIEQAVKQRNAEASKSLAEKSLAQSEATFRALSASSPIGIFLSDNEGRNIYANKRWEEISGQPAEEALGYGFANSFHPDDRDEALKSWADTVEKGHRYARTFRLQRPDGEVRWVEVRADKMLLDDGSLAGYAGSVEDITDRRAFEESLRREKDKLEAILASIGDGISIQDTDFRIIYQNRAQKELVGDHVGEYCYHAYEQKDQMCEGCPVYMAFKDGETHTVRRSAQTPKGPLHVEITASPLKDSDGNIIAGIEAVRNITERRKFEDVIKNTAEGVSAKTGETFFSSLVSYLAEAIGVDYAFVGELSPDAPGKTKTVSLYAKGEIVDNLEYDLPGTPCENVLGGELCAYPDSVQPKFPDDLLLAEMGIEAYIGTPLNDSSGTPLGLLVIMHTSPIKDAGFAESLLRIFAARASAELERTLVEKALAESEARYQGLFEDSPISIWDEDCTGVKRYIDSLREGGVTDFRAYFDEHPEEVTRCMSLIRVVDVNRAAVVMFGAKSKEDLLGNAAHVFVDASLYAFRDGLVALADGSTLFEAETVQRTLDGRAIYVTVDFSVPPGHERDLSRVIVSMTDITGRKEAEEALRESEEKFRSLVEGATIGVVIIQDGRFKYVNPSFARTLGYTRDELTGKDDLLEIIHPDFRETARENIRKRLYGEMNGVEYHIRMLKKDGAEVELDVQGKRALYEGRPAIIGTAVDVTSRMLGEKALVESEMQYHSLFEESPVALMELDASDIGEFLRELASKGVEDLDAYFARHPESIGECLKMVKVVDANKASVELYKAEAEHLLLDGVENITTPDTLWAIGGAISAAARGEAVFEADSAGKTLAGDAIDIHMKLSVVPGHEKTLSRVILSVRDITGQKKAETEIRESEKKFRDLVEKSLVGVYIIRKGRFLYVNPRLAEIFGYDRDELINEKTVKDTLHPDDRELVLENLRKREEHEVESIRYGFRGVRKDGRVINVEVFGSSTEFQGEPAVIGTLLDVTESKKAESELIDSRMMLSTLLDNLHGMVYRCKNDRDWTTEYVSDGCLELTGLHPGDLTSGNVSYNDLIFEEDRERLWKEVQEAIGKDLPFTTKYRIKTPAGAEKWIWDTGKAVKSGSGEVTAIEGFAMDDTERVRSEEDLHESQRTYSTLISNLPGMVYRCAMDREWTMEYVSDGCLALTGHPPLDLIGNNKVAYAELIHVADRERVWDEVSTALEEDRPFTLEYRIIAADSRLKWVWEQGRSVGPGPDGVTALEGFIIDITARKNAEEDKAAIFSMLTHDIRSPLSLIAGYNDMLAEKALDAEIEEMTGNIKKAVGSISFLIDDILALSKLESGKATLNSGPVVVEDIIKEAAGYHEIQAAKAGVSINIEHGEDMPVIQGDGRKLVRAVSNLVSNAICYNNEGGSVNIRTGTAACAGKAGGAGKTPGHGVCVFIEVTDTGIGIPKSKLQRVFDKYYRAEKTCGRNGTGLGLAIVKAIAELHGGSVSVDSVKGKYTRFTLLLPAGE